MKPDRFRTAGRLAETMELNKPRSEREEMKPLSRAEVREREFVQVKARRELGESMAGDTISTAFARILWPEEYGRPTSFDAIILEVMDDVDIARFNWHNAERTARLIQFRDNLRARATA